MESDRYYCQILLKLKLSRQSFEKSSNIKFQKICPLGTDYLHMDKQIW